MRHFITDGLLGQPSQCLVKALGSHTSASPEVLKRTREEHCHYPGLYSQDNLVKFEIHRYIIREDNPLHFDLTGFWARAHHQDLASSPALVPAPEDLLLHLCINFFLDRHNHSNGALGQVVDISESIQYYAAVLDWDLLAQIARQYGLAGPSTGQRPPAVYCFQPGQERFPACLLQQFQSSRKIW